MTIGFGSLPKTPPSCSHGIMKQFSINLEGPKRPERTGFVRRVVLVSLLWRDFLNMTIFWGLKINGICSTTCFLEMFYTRRADLDGNDEALHVGMFQLWVIREDGIVTQSEIKAKKNAKEEKDRADRIRIQNCMLNSAFCSTGGGSPHS